MALYVDGTKVTQESGDFISATGPDGAAGVIYGDYKYHTFTSTKTGSDGFVVAGVGVAPYNTIEYLVIAGGGGAGSWRGAGGGAGGYRTNMIGEASGGNSVHEAAMNCPAVANHDVTVGGGGAGASINGGIGTAGNDSVFNGITSDGGGYGYGTAGNLFGEGDGGSGGSGGGGGVNAWNDEQAGDGAAFGGSRTASPIQGMDGGDADGGNYAGGGGGGAGETGIATQFVRKLSPTGYGMKTGGDGLHSSITGSRIWRGGGGAGDLYHEHNNAGGRGGGGNSPIVYDDAFSSHMNGDANTGGGGGAAAGYQAAGSGGSGVVIIRYKYQDSGRVG